MARYRFMALSNAHEGRDADFNAWYDERHQVDVLDIPGVVSCERFEAFIEGTHKYLAVYEVETEDFGAVIGELGKRAGTDIMPISDAIDVANAQMSFWKPYSKA